MPETVVENVHSYYAIKLKKIVYVIMERMRQQQVCKETSFVGKFKVVLKARISRATTGLHRLKAVCVSFISDEFYICKHFKVST